MGTHKMSADLRDALWMGRVPALPFRLMREAADELDTISRANAELRAALESLFERGFIQLGKHKCALVEGGKWCDTHATSAPCIVGEARAALTTTEAKK